jgi:hypothetical protein
LLLALQILGAITFIWQELPEFRQVASIPASKFRVTIAPIFCWSVCSW